MYSPTDPFSICFSTWQKHYAYRLFLQCFRKKGKLCDKIAIDVPAKSLSTQYQESRRRICHFHTSPLSNQQVFENKFPEVRWIGQCRRCLNEPTCQIDRDVNFDIGVRREALSSLLNQTLRHAWEARKRYLMIIFSNSKSFA